MTRDATYHLVTCWRVEGTCGEVADVLGDPLRLAVWWPAVYLDVWEMTPPDARGVGGRVGVVTKGWLPYTLRWEMETLETRYPRGLSIAARGDLEGRGDWTFEQEGSYVAITYQWRVRARKPALVRLASLLRPLWEANHRWAMREGERSLVLELARRRATSAEARRAVAPPPGPVTYTGVAVLAVTAAATAGLAYLLVRTARRRRRR